MPIAARGREVAGRAGILPGPGEASLEYNKKYGKYDLFASIKDDLDKAGKNIGLMETHGPDPYALHDEIKAWIKEEANRRGQTADYVGFNAKDENRLDNVFRELTGEADIPMSRAVARVGSTIKAIGNFRYLNQVIYSTFSDWVNASDTLRRAGVKFTERSISAFIKNGAFTFLSRLPNLPHVVSGGKITGILNANRANTSLAIKLGLDVVMDTT